MLKELFIVSNQLNSLPESIGDLKQLQILDLRQNKLSSLPESTKNLQKLQELDLRYNQFKAIPSAIQNLNLKQYFLKLDENPLDMKATQATVGGIKAIQEFLRNKDKLKRLLKKE